MQRNILNTLTSFKVHIHTSSTRITPYHGGSREVNHADDILWGYIYLIQLVGKAMLEKSPYRLDIHGLEYDTDSLKISTCKPGEGTDIPWIYNELGVRNAPIVLLTRDMLQKLAIFRINNPTFKSVYLVV